MVTKRPSRYHQGSPFTARMDEVLDRGRGRDACIVIDWAGYYAGTPTEHIEEVRAIVDSITFEAP